MNFSELYDKFIIGNAHSMSPLWCWLWYRLNITAFYIYINSRIWQD